MSLSASAGPFARLAPITLTVQGVLFDMDGILISSLGAVERCWTRWAILRGIDPALAIKTAHGCRSIETVAKLRPDLVAADEHKIVEDMEVEDTEGLHVLPGVAALLAALPRDRWTVVTSATERLARARLAAGGIPVPERIVTAEMVERGKPFADPYLKGAELLGFAPADCLVLEDAASGANSGHAAGCKVVATTFSHSIKSLAAADYLIETLKDLTLTVAEDRLSFTFVPIVR
jgi:sugar-phosphatase